MATCALADEALAIWTSEALMKINKTFALQLPKQDFFYRSRPVEVETNIEVEALLVSGRRGLLA